MVPSSEAFNFSRNGYNTRSNQVICMPSVILVNPFSDSNVGSVSRALLNFGMTDLRVVAPECDILSDNARMLAVGSVSILENARVYASVREAIADLDTVVVTSARARAIQHLLLTPAETAKKTVKLCSKDPYPGHMLQSKCGIMFGREKNGLTNEEMALGDFHLSIPAFGQYDVLNLAQAVNIVAYECWKEKVVIELETETCSDQVGVDTRKEKEEKEVEEEEVEEKKSSTKKVKQQLDEVASKEELFFLLDRLERLLHGRKGSSPSELLHIKAACQRVRNSRIHCTPYVCNITPCIPLIHL